MQGKMPIGYKLIKSFNIAIIYLCRYTAHNTHIFVSSISLKCYDEKN